MFRCKQCAEKDRQIEYLQKLIDNLLQHRGIAPIVSKEVKIEETEDEKAERALAERGAQRYGE